MTNPLDTIKKLSNLEYTDFPFITMYIDTSSGNFLGQKEKTRIFLKNSFEKALRDKKKNLI